MLIKIEPAVIGKRKIIGFEPFYLSVCSEKFKSDGVWAIALALSSDQRRILQLPDNNKELLDGMGATAVSSRRVPMIPNISKTNYGLYFKDERGRHTLIANFYYRF